MCLHKRVSEDKMSRRNVNSTAGTSAGAATTPTAAQAAAAARGASVNSQVRMAQIFDDQDHKRCSDGNQRALLAENLDQLRGLVKVLEADDWKYSSSGGGEFAVPYSLQLDSEFATSRW